MSGMDIDLHELTIASALSAPFDAAKCGCLSGRKLELE
jgi:hypothetical protein